jgi:hypothetical protein
MRLTSTVSCAVGIAAAIALTASAADARSRYTYGGYAPYAYDGAYAYGGYFPPYRGPYFVYGANRAPYGWDKDNARDFQLQGSN